MYPPIQSDPSRAAHANGRSPELRPAARLEQHAAMGYDSTDGLPIYRFAVRATFCPGTGRRGACGCPSAEPPPRLRETGGITPGRLGPLMAMGAPAGAAATGVAGVSGAIGTADAAKGSSKKDARAMALEPQPRSHQPCRPGAEVGE